ncbi:hypothetical protein T439DRAFT_380344 [Meredithblackwellia eburnea MCA 4105]
MLYADTQFLLKCPNAVSVSQWCLSPPSNGTCCGICPNSGISGLEGHISLAFSSLSSIAAIALSPESAPSSLFVNLLQCNAYAISLLLYLLSDQVKASLDYFHAAYALMLALSSLIPLTAVTASPWWAVTGEENPDVRARRETKMIASAMKKLEALQDSDSDSSADSDNGKKARSRFVRAVKRHPQLLLKRHHGVEICGCNLSHWVLFIGFGGSYLLWLACFILGIWGINPKTGEGTSINLAQPNCTKELGESALFLFYCDFALVVLAAVVFLATIINPLLRDCAKWFGRESILSCTSNSKIVFGASFAVWVCILWMIMSFTAYFSAANTVLLAGSEFSWSFGSTFSALSPLNFYFTSHSLVELR